MPEARCTSHGSGRWAWLPAVAMSIGILALAAACEGRGPGEEQFRDWVEQRYAEPFRSGDTDRWVEAFSTEAVGMHHTLPALEGREAIRDFGRMVHDRFVIEQFDLTVNEVRVSGNWALTRGSFTSRFVAGGTDQTSASQPEAPATVGKFVLLWELEDDGEWRIVLDMGNLDSS